MSSEEKNETNYEEVDRNLVGFGGWLILLAFSLLMGAFFAILELVDYITDFSRINNKWYGLLAFEMPVLVGRLAYLFVALFRFFGKRKSAPATISRFLILNLKIMGVLFIVEFVAGADLLAANRLTAFVAGGLGAAIWIPYFKQSLRAKATFIR
jgi:uncharacterized membrane-anchored protein